MTASLTHSCTVCGSTVDVTLLGGVCPRCLLRDVVAEMMAALDHPAILPVHHRGEHDGIPFFTMKLVEGGTLAERQAHQRGVLHRDLKPGNVLFDSAGQVYVSDLGIAKLADSQHAALTLTSAMIGTPHYLAPEVAAGGGRAASVASDEWSRGVIFFELLTGEKPFPGETLTQILLALDASDVPRDLGVIAQ